MSAQEGSGVEGFVIWSKLVKGGVRAEQFRVVNQPCRAPTVGGCCLLLFPQTRFSEGVLYLEQTQSHVIILIIAIDAFLPTHIESFLHISL